MFVKVFFFIYLTLFPKFVFSIETKTKELDSELEEAAVEAAKSLPGDWPRTADDLMNRLAMYGEGKDPEKELSSTNASKEEQK